MKASQAQLRANAKYDKTNTKGLYIKLNINNDSDIIKYLDGKENVQGYIKALIREDMKSRM